MGPAVRVVEVGARDGLQNEKLSIPTEVKLRFVDNLLAAGLCHIEVTSFVSPKWVPQLADASELFAGLAGKDGDFYALVPNLKGLERANEVGVDRIALFTAASETFCRKNINMSQSDSLQEAERVIRNYLQRGAQQKYVRAYISTAFECPYEGPIAPEAVIQLAEDLFGLGVDEISFADTIGVAGPAEVRVLVDRLIQKFDSSRIAFHFHDTYGTAIANVGQAVQMGIRIFDSSAGGLGGCPFAPGAGGNLATEDLVYFLHREGWTTGVDLARLAIASTEVLAGLSRVPVAKAQVAVLSRASGGSCAI